jgi:hypothetical protein
MMALPALIDGEGPILLESLVGGTERAWGKSHSLKRLLLAHRSTSTQTLKVRFRGILDFGGRDGGRTSKRKLKRSPNLATLKLMIAKPAVEKDRRKPDELCGDEGRGAFRSDACEFVRDRRWWWREC